MLKETLFGKVGTEGLPSHHFITPHERSKYSLEYPEKASFLFCSGVFFFLFLFFTFLRFTVLVN